MNLAHFLFPQESNNHKAKIIHPSGLSLVLVFFLGFQILIKGFGVISPDVLGFASSISPDEVIRLTNEKRAQSGLSSLAYNPQLSQAAQAKAADMINRDYWAHVAPDGTQPWKFFGDSGYRYKYAGENLARDFSNPSSAIEAWMASPTHRDNMLSPKYKEIGIAVVEGDMNGVDTTIIVQLFGTRVGDSLPVAPIAAVTTESSPKPTTKVTSAPQELKTPVPTPVELVNLVATQSPSPTPTDVQQKILISPLNVTRTASAAIISVLLLVLLVDMFVIARRRISRVSSRSFAHFAFFAMIVAILVIAKAGNIL